MSAARASATKHEKNRAGLLSRRGSFFQCADAFTSFMQTCTKLLFVPQFIQNRLKPLFGSLHYDDDVAG